MLYPKVETGTHDMIINGELVQNVGDRTCYITSASDLQKIPADYPVGSLAMRFDATQIFVKVPGGQWQELNADE